MPVAEGDSAVIAAAENVDAAAILLRAIDVVWKIIVDGHVVELRRRLVVPTAPGAAAVYAHAYALAVSAARNGQPNASPVALGQAASGHCFPLVPAIG